MRVVFLGILIACALGTVNGGLEDLLGAATKIAGALGTASSGTFPRSSKCVISWSYQGQLRGIKWKYLGICSDSCTGMTETSLTNSRGGAIEHCLQNLLRKIHSSGHSEL